MPRISTLPARPAKAPLTAIAATIDPLDADAGEPRRLLSTAERSESETERRAARKDPCEDDGERRDDDASIEERPRAR